MTYMSPGRNRWKSHYENERYRRAAAGVHKTSKPKPETAPRGPILYKYYLALVPRTGPPAAADHQLLGKVTQGRAVMLTNTGYSFIFKPRSKENAQGILSDLKGKLSGPHQVYYFFDSQYLTESWGTNTKLYPDGSGVNIPDDQRLKPLIIT